MKALKVTERLIDKATTLLGYAILKKTQKKAQAVCMTLLVTGH